MKKRKMYLIQESAASTSGSEKQHMGNTADISGYEADLDDTMPALRD